MGKPNRNRRRRQDNRAPVPSDQPPRRPTHAGPLVSMARYAAPGDDPITTPARLTLQTPFRIEPGWVKRLQRRDVNPKEAFTIHDGGGDYFRASVRELDTDGGSAVPYERMTRSPEPTIDLTLACSVLARQRMIFVMQKATELGVSRVVPLLTDHSVPPDGLDHERANSWPAQVVRAAKQCRRASLPEVMPPMTLDAFLASPVFTTADAAVVLDDRDDPSPAPAARPTRVVLFVGPEGGFSDAEREQLADKTRPWFLGGRIFRAETAVLVGLTAVHLKWGDFAP